MVADPGRYIGQGKKPPTVTAPNVPPSMQFRLTSPYTLSAGGILYFQSDPGIYQEGVGLLTNSGLIFDSSASATGIADANENPTPHTFQNTASGILTVLASGSGGDAYGYNGGGAGNPVAIDNQGVIQVVAPDGNAVGSYGYGGYSGASFTNETTGLLAVWASGTGVGLGYGQTGVALVNDGLIYVTAGSATAVEDPNSFDNKGRIIAVDIGNDGGSVGVDIGPATTVYGGTGTFTNSGTIRADTAFQLDGSEYLSGGTITLNNSGKIFGKINFSTYTGNLVINNSGSIDGSTYFGDGDNTYAGSMGSQTGGIYLGSGDNSIQLGADAGDVYGAQTGGTDSITGGAGNDFIEIFAGDNTINGGGGVNTLSFAGAAVGVTVNLATGVGTCNGTDRISNISQVIGSTSFKNKLKAGATGAELVAGNLQDDLIGGTGADTLVAGAGGDLMAGGGGNNLFVYSQGDRQLNITDYRQNGDVDTLDIYGYAAAKSIFQLGADTEIALSSTDRIILKDTQAASLDLASIVFMPNASFQAPAPASGSTVVSAASMTAKATPSGDTHAFVAAMAVHSHPAAATSPAFDTFQRLDTPQLLASRY